MPPDRDRIVATLEALDALLEREGIWHCLAYGTLLGAVREGDVIAWDHDLDLFARAADVGRLVALTADGPVDGIELRQLRYPARWLPVHQGVTTFDPGHLWVLHEGDHVGDVFTPSLFADGVLRFFDLAAEVFWTPQSSVPHWFFEEATTVEVAGRPYPAPRAPEALLAGIYGDDWRTPYRSVVDGGTGKDDVTAHGDRYAPKLHREVPWCEEQGWDRSQYRWAPAWPRRVRGAGPRGPDERTRGSSEALWWRDLEELVAHY
jgi:hypothetical protein